MHLPPLLPVSNSQIYIKGDVSIDDSAIIAPGVIIQADSDSRILIASGVCIGMGAILHAHKGTLEVEAGAILGAGVLLVGQGKIGANACIGAATTIWNSSVEPWQVIPAGSLLGETGRQVAEVSQPSAEDEATEPSTQEVTEVNEQPPAESHNGETSPTPNSQPTTEENASAPIESTGSPVMGGTVYGKANLNQLLLTLFPHYKSVNPPPNEDGQSP